MTKIGITGSTGSLGKIILKNHTRFSFSKFKGDIRNKNEINGWVKKNNLDIIIHLAAIVPIKEVNKNKKKAWQVNYLGTKNLIDICVKRKIKWFFFSSTSHVYNSSKKKISENNKLLPISYYGKTKLLAEKYIIKRFKKNKIRFCIGRIFSTTNKNQKKNYLVPDLKHKIEKAKYRIVLKNLNHYRDFISMKDIAKIIFFLLKDRYSGIINFGTGNGIHLKDIARIISKKHKKHIIFKDNKKKTYLVADIRKLRKIYKFKFSNVIKKEIF